MANALYPKGREGILDRTIDMTGDIKAMLVKSTYAFNTAHKFVSDLGSVDNGRTAVLTDKTYTDGIFDVGDTNMLAIANVACKSIVLFQDTGNNATSRLICYIDSPSSGLPCTPAVAQTLNVIWDNSTNKIFKL